MDRRQFLRASAAAAGGVLFSVSLTRCSGEKPSFDGYLEQIGIGAFVWLKLDGDIEIMIPKPEMGQGVRQALAMLVAEELNADWNRVHLKQANLDARFGDQQVSGSYSIIALWEPMRQAGAAVRELLCEAAAKKWRVKRTMVEIKDHRLIQRGKPGTTLDFADVAMDTLSLTLPSKVQLKDPADFTLIGTTPVNKDHEDLVRGQPMFTNDQTDHHDRVAVIVRCPFLNGRYEKHTPLDPNKHPNVIKVLPLAARPAPAQTYPGVAIVAYNTHAAMKAAKSLKIVWKQTSKENSRDLFTQASAAAAAKEVFVQGDPAAVFAKTAPTVQASYQLPFLAHAPMEPMTCRVEFFEEQVVIWAPTQSPAWATQAVADLLSIEPEKVKINVMRMGGAFGRRVNPDFVLEAAAIAKHFNEPVTLLWTREDDMRFGFFRPANVHQLKATLDEAGMPLALEHHLFSSSITSTYNGVGHETAHVNESRGGAMDMPYAVAASRFLFTELQTEVRQGWWRAVEYGYNIFAIECFIDEMAAAANQDPLAFRLKLLAGRATFQPKKDQPHQVEPKRLAAVLSLAAEKAGYVSKQKTRGANNQQAADETTTPATVRTGTGFAGCWFYTSRTYVGLAVTVTVDPSDNIRVTQIQAAVDCGVVIDPDSVKAQVEGSLVYGLSAALYGEITVVDGRVQQSNFDDYPVLRMRDMPAIEVHLVPSSAAPGGIGEPALPPLAPALCNAVYAASGRRIRSLPLQKKENPS